MSLLWFQQHFAVGQQLKISQLANTYTFTEKLINVALCMNKLNNGLP